MSVWVMVAAGWAAMVATVAIVFFGSKQSLSLNRWLFGTTTENVVKLASASSVEHDTSPRGSSSKKVRSA